MYKTPVPLDDRLQPKSEDDYKNDTYTIKTDCVDCGTTHTAVIPASGLYRYRMLGEFLQVAFPNLTAEERELHFISQVCGSCWAEMFSDEEDDEDGADDPSFDPSDHG